MFWRTKKIVYNGALHVVEPRIEREFWQERIMEGKPDLGYATDGTWEDIA